MSLSGHRPGSDTPPGDAPTSALIASAHTEPPSDAEPVTVAGGQLLLRGEAIDFQRGDLLDGRYQIEKVIGRGATGCVLQAFDRVVRTVVAVKILKPELAADERWVARLGGELRYARKLQHPNVCRVYDVGSAEGHHFLTMEFASGGSLRQRLLDPSYAARPWDQRIRDARAVIEGLAAIHAEEIVHRDVKPENVLVMEDGRLVVTDFGVAITQGHATYFSSKVAGTPNYMAPEVLMDDRPATMASDVWSMGVTLHEILFGKRPEWDSTEQGRVIKQVVDRKAPAPMRSLARLCTECLTEFAPRRPADASVVKQRFEMAVRGRLRPLRQRLGKRSAMIAVASVVVVAASTMVISRAVRQPALHKLALLHGKTADLGVVSRRIMAGNDAVRCFDALPGRNRVRLVLNRSSKAVDVHIPSGREEPSNLAPEAVATGCPRLSPDGRRLLYVHAEKGRPNQIMLSERPDGRGAQVVTEGDSPVWLPSGEEFVYAVDKRKAAVFSLPKSRTFFPDFPPSEKLIDDIGVSERGDQVAFSFHDDRRENLVEVYSYPSMQLLQAFRSKQMLYGVAFDDRRRSVVVSVADPRDMTLAELTKSGDFNRVFALSGASVQRAVRMESGVVFLVAKATHSLLVRRHDGAEKMMVVDGISHPSVSAAGDILMDARLPNGNTAITLHRWDLADARFITAGPNDAYPSFGPDGRSFAFVRKSDNSLVSCVLPASETPSNCHAFHREPLGARYAVMSPDGKLIAYRTVHGSAARVRVVPTAGGTARDLGVRNDMCPTIWSSPTGLWMLSTSTNRWWEVDVSTGTATGRTHPVSINGKACEQAPAPSSSSGYITRRRISVSFELRAGDSL